MHLGSRLCRKGTGPDHPPNFEPKNSRLEVSQIITEKLKDMSSGRIVGALIRPITELEELPALANDSCQNQNVGHLHMPIRAECGPQIHTPATLRNGTCLL